MDVLAALRCPLCASSLAEVASGHGRTLRCASGHSFDVARQGYVSLDTGRRAHPGDTAEMIAARAELLGAGHYAFVTDAIVDSRAGGAVRGRAGPRGGRGRRHGAPPRGGARRVPRRLRARPRRLEAGAPPRRPRAPARRGRALRHVGTAAARRRGGGAPPERLRAAERPRVPARARARAARSSSSRPRPSTWASSWARSGSSRSIRRSPDRVAASLGGALRARCGRRTRRGRSRSRTPRCGRSSRWDRARGTRIRRAPGAHRRATRAGAGDGCGTRGGVPAVDLLTASSGDASRSADQPVREDTQRSPPERPRCERDRTCIASLSPRPRTRSPAQPRDADARSGSPPSPRPQSAAFATMPRHTDAAQVATTALQPPACHARPGNADPSVPPT